MKTVSENRCFDGVQGVYRHASDATGGEMTFAVYLPPEARIARVPCLWWLSGLTCTHENAMTKAGAQAMASELGMALIFPDTSPRGEGVADDEAYDLGQGAGFYVDATETPWAAHFKMQSYILDELKDLIVREFPIEEDRMGVSGHSMGGHGALTLAMKRPEQFRSLSAFAPIANPSGSDWGRKQLGAYLGGSEADWRGHDAAHLLEDRGWKGDILVDQGGSDQFLELLRPESLSAAMARTRTGGAFRMQPGYDHSYYFVASFMADHLIWHGERL